MIELDRPKFGFNIKEIWFADAPYDVEGADIVYFHGCKNKLDLAGFDCQEHNTLTIDLTQDINTIWNNMSKSSCRYAINKAKRDGVIIRYPAERDGFYALDKRFRASKNIAKAPDIIYSLSNNSILFTASLNNELLSGQLYIYDNANMRLLVSASKRFEADKNEASIIGNANHLLVWEAINYAKYREIKTFDLGGYNSEKYPTVASFKKSFGGVVTPYYTYVKIYSKLLKTLKMVL